MAILDTQDLRVGRKNAVAENKRMNAKDKKSFAKIRKIIPIKESTLLDPDFYSMHGHGD